MCEITNENFEEKYPEIIENLRSAAFLSVDCEFSGLDASEPRHSFFDSAEEIFKRKQKSFGNYHIVEFGLSTFHFDRKTNNFSASSYSFYILPFVNHMKSSKFTWQLGSVNFLCTHKFDFNKVFHNGISYVNKTEEAVILDMIDNETIIDVFNEEDIQIHYSKILKWSSTALEGEELLLELEGKQLALVYVLQFEIRKNITNVWTSREGRNVIKVKKVSTVEKLKLLSDKKEEAVLKSKIFDSIVGFTKIVQEIERLQKPVVGHNFLSDLILIYQQFYNPKPVSYTEFKQNIHRIFPCIYDTKIFSFALHAKIPRGETWQSNCLCDLYSYFKKGNGANKTILSPKVLSREENYSNLENFHEAGFDSYCTGYCFVKMAYLLLTWDERKKKFGQITVSKTVTSLLAAVKYLSNQLNMPRSDIRWMALDGSDPKRSPPLLLRIQSKGNQKLSLIQVSQKLAEYYMIDFKPLDRYSGVISISNKNYAKEIWNYFEDRNDFIVTDYSFLKHSFWGKTIVRSCLVSAILGVIITSKVLHLSKFVRLT